MLDQALAFLNDDRAWKGLEKQRNLINSFARAYDQLIYRGQTLQIYWDKTHVPAMEVCFNATEFYRGLSFRFQTEGTDNPHQVIGNNYLYFDHEAFATFRLLKLGRYPGRLVLLSGWLQAHRLPA